MKWAKIASNLHSNPKVFATGVDGCVAFVFLLCKHAEEEFDGVVKARFANPTYLGAFTQLGPDRAAAALAACEREELIEIASNGDVHIIGWDSEWRAGLTEAERKRKQRSSVAERRLDKKLQRHALLRPDIVRTNVRTRPDNVTDASDPEESRDLSGVVGSSGPALFSDHPTSSASPLPAAIVRSPEDQTRAHVGARRAPTGDANLDGWGALSADKRKVLARHLGDAQRLWALQGELRGALDPSLRPLKATAARLWRVAALLEAGVPPDDCEAVLRHYADDGDARWFNGETNWRPGNFDRALGMAGAKPTRSAGPPDRLAELGALADSLRAKGM